MTTKQAAPRESLNWLGFPSPFSAPGSRGAVPWAPATAPLGILLNHRGDAAALEETDVRLSRDRDALRITACCRTADMARVRELAARTVAYARDAWGDDAIELQIDVQRTRTRYFHFMLPPNGIAVTLLGFSNRQVQGWNPRFDFRVELRDDAWLVEVVLPFAILGRIPEDGEAWGFNVMRVNRSEPTRYAQWAPTFGEALRPERFGEIRFGGEPGDRAAEAAAYARHAAERRAFFIDTINGVRDEDALKELGEADWTAWGARLARRESPLPLSWFGFAPGAAGISALDRPVVLAKADMLVDGIAGWPTDPPDPAAFVFDRLELLGDAFLLTGARKYVEAFERALDIHGRLVRDILRGVTDPRQLPYSRNPYYDIYVVRTARVAYTYLTMRREGLSPRTHAVMMWTVLRSGRFAAFNIASDYTYGNHQTYESGGLATVAALFPEFPDSDGWARVAARAIRLHLEREVYPDGGYYERCGYHEVALTFTMQAVATIRADGAEARFADLMNPATLGTLERMHQWSMLMTAPDGSFPAFGDYAAHPQVRLLRRGAAVFGRPDFAWPVRQAVPELVPPGIVPREPEPRGSVALDSHFTVLRDGWAPTDFYMAVDHGPLGGQHSHIDTVGFVAFAHGRPVALDSGIGANYEDPRYGAWFRSLRAHNVVAIDDLEPEKVAERVSWEPGADVDVLGTRSRAYERALGVVHDRTIHFAKGVGWLVHDRLAGPASFDFAAHAVDWLLHTPYELEPVGPGVLDGGLDGFGLMVLAGRPHELEAPQLELKPASMPGSELRELRNRDVGPRADPSVPITSLSWRKRPMPGRACEFAFFVLPYRGGRPDARLTPGPAGWTLSIAGRPDRVFRASE